MTTEANRMKTQDFEDRMRRVAGKIYEEWPEKIGRQPFMWLRQQQYDFPVGDKIARRMASYDMALNDYLYLVSVYEIDYELHFEYFGIEPDESSDLCLAHEYSQAAVLRALKQSYQQGEQTH